MCDVRRPPISPVSLFDATAVFRIARSFAWAPNGLVRRRGYFRAANRSHDDSFNRWKNLRHVRRLRTAARGLDEAGGECAPGRSVGGRRGAGEKRPRRGARVPAQAALERPHLAPAGGVAAAQARRRGGADGITGCHRCGGEAGSGARGRSSSRSKGVLPKRVGAYVGVRIASFWMSRQEYGMWQRLGLVTLAAVLSVTGCDKGGPG